MKLIMQIGIVFAICLLGEVVVKFFPIPFPSSVMSMVILFLLLLFKILKTEHIHQKTNFLLKNMAFFFIPAGVGMMENFEVIKETWWQLLLICLITVVLTFWATAYTVKAVILLQNRRGK